MLQNKKSGEFGETPFVETRVEFAFVAAIGGVLLEDVAVASAEFFQD